MKIARLLILVLMAMGLNACEINEAMNEKGEVVGKQVQVASITMVYFSLGIAFFALSVFIDSHI